MLYLLLSVGNFFGDQINPRHVLEDAYDGLVQLSNNPELAGAFSLTVISIGKKLGEGNRGSKQSFIITRLRCLQ